MERTKYEKTPNYGGLVPKTGFEPAHPFGRYHLKVVRLPISPPGQVRGFKDFKVSEVSKDSEFQEFIERASLLNP